MKIFLVAIALFASAHAIAIKADVFRREASDIDATAERRNEDTVRPPPTCRCFPSPDDCRKSVCFVSVRCVR